ncbi:hypothetical protein NCC49_002651 [Naganishia albida]|nr:hypothetical protein NCC49_002651 [Naganishia albida]
MADHTKDRHASLGTPRGYPPFRSQSSIDVGHSPMSSRETSHLDLKSLENGGGLGYGYAAHSGYGEGMPEFPLSTGGAFFAHQYPASSNGETPNISRSPSVVFPSGIAGASSGLLERRRTSGNAEAIRAGQSERWGAGTGWRSRMTLIWGMRFGWIVMVIWCEVGEFFHSVSGCRFPDSRVSTAHLGRGDGTYPTHVVLLADPQIPHPTLSYPSRSQPLQKITTWFIDLYMRKSWDVLRRLGRIDAVIMAGDMMDWGRGVFDDQEYRTYLDRFKSIFSLPDSTPMYYVPGNHDLGLGPNRLFSPYAKQRYAENFTPPNALINIANHTFIMLDAVSLIEEDYRRYAAEVQLGEWEGVPGGVIEFIKNLSDNPPPGPKILISHIPLARPESSSCGPLREKGKLLKGAGIGYQNLLGSETTRFLLNYLKPDAIYSGDDHDYCEYWHPTGVKETTLKAFSMAMGVNRPGFQLMSLVPPPAAGTTSRQHTFADVPCLLPDQLQIYFKRYIPLATVCILLLFYLNLKQVISKFGGWTIGSSTAPDASPTPRAMSNGFNNGAGLSPYREKSPAISRKSSQVLKMSPVEEGCSLGGTARSRPGNIRRITKSAPGSPRVSLTPLEDEESRMPDGLYMNQPGPRTRTTAGLYISPDATPGSEKPTRLTEEPSPYFLPLPDGAASRNGTPTRPRPLSRKTSRMMSTPSDWISAAKAKDMTVMQLVFDPDVKTRNRRLRILKQRLATVGKWLGGRNGVLAKTTREVWKVLWPTLLVWLAINASFFL